MLRKKTVRKLPTKTHKRLVAKLHENYATPNEFYRLSGVPVSPEWCRHVLGKGQPTTVPSLILICKYLNFTPSEIQTILIEVGDTEFSDIIGKQMVTREEKALISVYRKIKNKGVLTDQFGLIAKAEKISITSELNILKKGR